MSSVSLAQRHEKERAHGRAIAACPEKVWGQSSFAGKMRLARRASLILKETAMKPGMQVLEIGCGNGNYTKLFVQTGARVIAIDLSEDLLARARESVPSARFSCTDAESLEGIESESVDLVVGNAVLHHLDAPLALRAAWRVLRPGGKLCFTEPNMLNPQIALQKNIPPLKRLLGDSPDETAFIKWPMRRMLREAGFEDLRVYPFDFLHPWTPGFLAVAAQPFLRLLEYLPLVREIAGSLLITARKPKI